MGTIIGTCGHDITKEWEEVKQGITTMDYDDGDRVLSYSVVCKVCKEKYEKWGIVLHNEEEENAWLAGKTVYPISDESPPQV